MKKISLFSLLLIGSLTSFSKIKLPRLISDGMILQRGNTIKLWGQASADEVVNLSFKAKTYQTKADESGYWEIKLPPEKAGGPYEMAFSGSNRIILKDVLFGDVWLCSGQSNMELPMSRVMDKYPEIIAAANQNQIRQFIVPDEYDFKTARTDFFGGEWVSTTPTSVLNFSAAAYFFALDINRKFHIPIGIVNAALGGSPAQAWMSEMAIKKFPSYDQDFRKYKDDQLIKSIEAADKTASNAWYSNVNQLDEGLKKNWKHGPAGSDWAEMQVPGYWANELIGKANGVVWFKKEIDVPQSMVTKPAKLLLGRIVDADSVFINGEFVGSTSYQYPPRKYLFGSEILKAGKNTITVRVINNAGEGGFVPNKEYQLIAGTDTLDLKGTWKYKLGVKAGPSPGQTFIRWKPVGLYNAMIAPLKNYAIKGVLWYQGESNAGNPKEYFDLMESLIIDWRNTFSQPQLPFIAVQLPNFMQAKENPSESSWAELRAQQARLLTIKNTALVVAIDLGEWNDIHPLNKQDIGKRMALQAGRLAYGDVKTVASGPTFKSAVANGNTVILSFDNVGKGLISKSSSLKAFAIAGSDKKFKWAQAEIRNQQVILSNATIPAPVYVRYAWADNPQDANLYNKNGLPTAPFEAIIK
jgi:sialate O-acetylesterase